MNRLLLSMTAALLMGSSALAETVTFDFKNNDYGLDRESNSNAQYIVDGKTVTSGDVTLTLRKTEDSGWRLWTDGLRIYKNSGASIEVAATDALITGLDFTMKSSGIITAYSVDGGAEVSVSGATFSWADEDGVENPKIALTCPSKNGSIVTLTVTYEPAGDADLLPAGLSFPQTAYSVAFGDTFEEPVLTHTTDAAITYASSTPDVATVDPATGAVEILAVGTTTITASAEANSTYNAGSASYTLTVEPAFTSIENAFTYEDAAQGIVNFPLTVTYQNGTSTYVTDGTGYSLVFGTVPTYQVGDVIPAGWKAEIDFFNGIPELKVINAPAAAVETAEFTPRQVTAVDNTMINEVCILKNVEFTEATPTGSKTNFDGLVGDATYTFRNNFTDVPSVEPGTYDVLIAVATYRDALQLYPLSYTESDPSGIENIETVDGEAQYFNLQGVRVESPENGLYIRVINGKAQKVAVK